MKLPEPNGGGNFTPTPAGQHMAVLTRLIDLGTQPGSQAFPDPKHKILLGWEIPGHRIEWTKDDQTHEGPVVHFERMTFSMHEKAILRQRLESWRGKPFTEGDFGNFDMQNLLRVGALIQIAHDHKDGKTYANMQAIMLPPGGKDAWAKPEGDVLYLSLDPDEFDQSTYDKLSNGLQETIAKSPEYQKMFGPMDTGQGNYGHSDPARQAPQGGAPAGGYEDPLGGGEIPFNKIWWA